MSNKTDQMNIRISANLKEKIQLLAKNSDLKTSDFVRQTLENTIEGKVNNPSYLGNLSNLKKREQNLFQAVAFIAHIDTGKPIDHCMQVIAKIGADFTDFDNLTNLSREEREKESINVRENVAQELNTSPLGRMFISLIVLTYYGIVYEEDYFKMTPLSLDVLEMMRNHLEQQKI